jgi:NAD(P)H-dependent flavin oxidoreductase YrpB (nitropropane dioxygenase family)
MVTDDLHLGVETLGQSVGLVKDIPTTAELLERMVREAKTVLSKTQKIF